MNTSQYLRDYLKEFDDEPDHDEPMSEEEKEWHELYRRLEIESVESLLPHELTELIHDMHSRRDMLEFGLDDFNMRYFLDDVPKIVKRALKLEPLFIKKPMDGPVEIYVREASRAYLFGLFQGSVALTRSAIEQALREHLRTKAPHLAQTNEFLSLLRGAELSKSPDGPLLQFAHEVRKRANEVLHGTPCGDQEAFDLLIKTRKVVDALYGGRK